MSLVTPFYSSHIVSDGSNDDPEQNGSQITFVLRSLSSGVRAVAGQTPEHMTHRQPDVTAARADKLTMAGYLKERLNVEKVTCTNFRLMKWLLINCSEQSPADTNIQSVWCFPTK